MFYKIKRYFRNLVRYHEILAKDEDFDYVYLYEIVLKKLIFMEKHHRNSEFTNYNNSVIPDEILDSIKILKRLINDDYLPYEGDKYFQSMSFDKLLENKQDEKVREKIIKWFIEEEKQRNKDKSDFLKIINEKIEGWWD